ncbi:DUF4935 domain-containing protein [Rhodohalobacter sp. SW132]|uniref:S1 family peptidase n=1 Tax=Rhodohalobacter sp. SW132 TaxID=2293433 RepID=UPI000E243A0B|nr:serine protease [Rhodohalobacter sp. SW132]REL39124.1 DUF4935 domain-containing protein [Rhodohalobacter sp. SW132]
MEKSIQKKIEHPETMALDRQCKWIRPEFMAIDGIGEHELWTLKGLIVAIGFIDDEKQKIIGSGVMIAPGLCITATHVIEETKNLSALLYSIPSENSMRIWTPIDFHTQEKVSIGIIPFQNTPSKYTDVGILSYSPLSKFTDKEDYFFAPLEASAPKINERLWATGYRETHNDGIPTISFFVTSGLVTEQYLQGRGSHINGPCIEVAMEAFGGMSGGPVFNDEGRIVGVISSSLEDDNGNNSPTYVSLIWTSLTSTVYSPWPENHWPKNLAGIQTAIKKNGAKLIGSARFDDEGSYKVKFPEQSSDSMLSVLKSAGIKFPTDDYDIHDYSYDNFEDFLEEEGLNYLSSVDKKTFDLALMKKDYTETIKLFDCIGASTMGGLEDLNIESIKLINDGTIGIDALFNIRNSVLKLKITRDEYESHKDLITSLSSLYNQETDGINVLYDHYVRPFYRVNFIYDIQSEEYQEIRFQFLFLKI